MSIDQINAATDAAQAQLDGWTVTAAPSTTTVVTDDEDETLTHYVFSAERLHLGLPVREHANTLSQLIALAKATDERIGS